MVRSYSYCTSPKNNIQLFPNCTAAVLPALSKHPLSTQQQELYKLIPEALAPLKDICILLVLQLVPTQLYSIKDRKKKIK